MHGGPPPANATATATANATANANANAALAADAAGRLRAVLWLDDDGGHYLHQALGHTPNPTLTLSLTQPHP